MPKSLVKEKDIHYELAKLSAVETRNPLEVPVSHIVAEDALQFTPATHA